MLITVLRNGIVEPGNKEVSFPLNHLYTSPIVQAPEITDTFTIIHSSYGFCENGRNVHDVHLLSQFTHVLFLGDGIGDDKFIDTGSIDE